MVVVVTTQIIEILTLISLHAHLSFQLVIYFDCTHLTVKKINMFMNILLHA